MGNNNTHGYRVLINVQEDKFLYYTGEKIQGNVTLHITDEQFEVSEISLMLIGEIAYKCERNKTKSMIRFYSNEIQLIERERIIFNQGEYRYPFESQLPTDSLPPTMNQTKDSVYVQYYLQLNIDQSNTIIKRKYLTIYPHVNLFENLFSSNAIVLGNRNRKEISLLGSIGKIEYIPDDSIDINFQIHNPRKKLIHTIFFTMLQIYRIGKSVGENIIFRYPIEDIINTKSEQIKKTFSFRIPSQPLPPSYLFKKKQIHRSLFVQIKYLFRLEIKVEGVVTSFNADIPFLLGTQSNPNLYQQQTSIDSLPTYDHLNFEQSIFNDEDLPPSYESVV